MQAISATFRRLLSLALALALAGGVVACRSLPAKGEKGQEAAAPAPEPMRLPTGTVELVDEAGGFVLIRSGRGLVLEPGTVLTIHGDRGEEVATVSVSPAKKGPFLTADIVAGTPLRGQTSTMAHLPATGGPNPFPTGPDDGAVQVLE